MFLSIIIVKYINYDGIEKKAIFSWILQKKKLHVAMSLYSKASLPAIFSPSGDFLILSSQKSRIANAFDTKSVTFLDGNISPPLESAFV